MSAAIQIRNHGLAVLILSAHLNPVAAHGPTLEFCQLRARRLAREEGLPMVVGFEQNEECERVYGYCPLSVVGPAFVIEPLFVYTADGKEHTIEVVS